jgi:hypothetical protein
MDNKHSISEYVEILGKNVEDKVTGLQGVVTSISFDLYGCIQVIVHPGLDKDGKLKELQWFDYNRITIMGNKRVMPLPTFIQESVNKMKGPEKKPLPRG